MTACRSADRRGMFHAIKYLRLCGNVTTRQGPPATGSRAGRDRNERQNRIDHRCAASCVIRFPSHELHNPRFLHENATTMDLRQVSPLAWTKPRRMSPQPRNDAAAFSMKAGSPRPSLAVFASARMTGHCWENALNRTPCAGSRRSHGRLRRATETAPRHMRRVHRVRSLRGFWSAERAAKPAATPGILAKTCLTG